MFCAHIDVSLSSSSPFLSLYKIFKKREGKRALKVLEDPWAWSRGNYGLSFPLLLPLHHPQTLKSLRILYSFHHFTSPSPRYGECGRPILW